MRLYDIIRFVYKETSETENKRIEREIFEQVSEASESFFDTAGMKSDLNQLKKKASRSVTDRILAYSKNYKNTEPAD